MKLYVQIIGIIFIVFMIVGAFWGMMMLGPFLIPTVFIVTIAYLVVHYMIATRGKKKG